MLFIGTFLLFLINHREVFPITLKEKKGKKKYCGPTEIVLEASTSSWCPSHFPLLAPSGASIALAI